MSPYSVDDIVSAVRLGHLTPADGEAALYRLGVSNPGRLLPNPVRVTPSPLLPPRVDQWGRGAQTFVDQWGRGAQ